MDSGMQGKTCVVTGATNGIGLATATALARLGATVVGVGRNPAKCADAEGRIKAAAGAAAGAATSNDRVEFLVADLSSQQDVRRLAETIMLKYPRLDVLVNNAGGFFMSRQVSVDGIEMNWALNHLSYFLLTNLLLDHIRVSAPARIVNVASGAHLNAAIRFDDPEFKKGYRGMGAYGHSKLANVLFTYELARRLDGSRVTANALHPGFTATGFGLNNGPLVRLGMRVVQRFGARTPEQGAETCIYLASSPEVEGVTGKYFFEKRAIESSPASYDRATAARLWDLSERMTHLIH